MKYAQLKPAAQERARQWFKDSEAEMWGSERAPDYYEDMATCLKFLGITVNCERTTQHRTLPNGNKHEWERTEWGFEWSGFWSQGDGLVFQGKWNAAEVDLAGLMEYAPRDETLKRICIQMMAIMLKWPESFADITTVNYGPGLPAMHTNAYSGYYEFEDNIGMPDEDQNVLQTQIIAAAHWCYRQLETSYEYDTGDEAAVEGIEANDYDFNRDGDRITCSRPRRQLVAATSCPKGVTS